MLVERERERKRDVTACREVGGTEFERDAINREQAGKFRFLLIETDSFVDEDI